MIRTLEPGTLIVHSAYPDPPFDVMKGGVATGFDIELMRSVCRHLGLKLRAVPYAGDDFNGIFDGLTGGNCDAVISGTTINEERAKIVGFSRPYLVFNQGIAVNRSISPQVKSTQDLRGLTAGIQSGNTSDIVARQLLSKGDIAGIRYYPYHGIMAALGDLEAGRIGLVIKLFPVITYLARERPLLEVPLQVPTQEHLGIAFAKDRSDLCDAVDSAIESIRKTGEFAQLQANWPGMEATA
jgi:polar amino acid transport system substrate-binding protein